MCSGIKKKVTITSLVLATVRAQSDIGTNATSQLAHFCRRFEHRTAVLNNKLYIDGGYINSNPLEKDGTNFTNSLLLYSELLMETSFGFPRTATASVKDASVPSLAGGSLWADQINGKFFSFGGYFPSSSPSPFDTWMYDDSHGSWGKAGTTGDLVSYVAHGMSTVAQDAGAGYYLGGYHDAQTQKQWTSPRLYTPNLIEFDMVKHRYSNLTGPDKKGRGEGLMVFIPASTSGLLIYFGGIVQEPPDEDVSGMPMKQIWIYDISLRKWYMQYATGNIPDERTRFCGGAAWPDDKSSFNIYIYGGLRPNGKSMNGSTAFDDLYILSLPGFVWVKMYPHDFIPDNPRHHHSLTCDVVNGTQMIILGGTFPDASICDSTGTYGQHNVDLGELNEQRSPWNLFRSDNPPYRLPSGLTHLIGGNDRGGANITGPLLNRTYDKYLFEKAYKVTQRYPTPTEIVPVENKSKTSRSVLIRAIIGSIIGGFLIGIVAFYVLRFLKQRRISVVPSNKRREHIRLEKMVDKKNPLEELRGQDILELPIEDRAELWVDPVELYSA